MIKGRIIIISVIDNLIKGAAGQAIQNMNLRYKFKEDDSKFKVILLVSDGEDHQGIALDIAKQAKEKDVIIHSLGVGTISGAPIPLLDE